MSNPGRLRVALAVTLLFIGVIHGSIASADPGWVSTGITEVVSAIALDPTSEGIVYALGSSGLWKSADGGANWSLVSPEKLSYALLIDPKNPSIMYSSGNQVRGGGGIYKSTDEGRNWSIVRSGESPGVMALDPVNTSIIYAGVTINSNYEVLKSLDGGATWNPLLRPVGSQPFGIGWVSALALAPTRTSTVYAGLGGYHNGDVMRSYDGGSTWTNQGSSGALAPLMVPSAIAVDPRDSNVVYAAWALMGYKMFFKSLDGGNSWQDLSSGLPQGGASVSSLIVDPSDRSTLIATMPGESSGSNARPGGVFISYDGGSSWSELERAGADKSKIVLAPNKRLLYAGGANGVSIFRLGFRLDPRFQSYYDSHDGLRILGSPISHPLVLNGYFSQYFEKGRIEDHSHEVDDANWKFMYGLLVDELQAAKSSLPVGGDVSSVTYADLHNYARPEERIAPTPGFEGGVIVREDGSAFVPYHHELTAEAGHSVPKLFWDYINRDDLFPGGWLHDVGLPMTEAVSATVDKGDMKGRSIMIQAFQRTVLTYDPADPPDWQVERANVGTDYLK